MLKLHVLLATILGLLTFLPGNAHAQAGPCPEGMSQYASPNGVPTCGPMVNQTQAPVPLVEFYGALAIDSRMHVSGSWNFPSADGAMNSAYDACIQGNTGGCRIIGNEAFTRCMAVAADGAGRVFGVPDKTCHGTIGETMDWCKSQSKVGGCHMLTGVIRAGTNRRDFTAENRKQLSFSPDELAALSAER